MKSIETERLNLRGWKLEDYLDFYEYASDERVCHSAGCGIIKSIEDSKRNIELYISSNQCYAIVLKSENKVIGSIGIDNVAPDKTLKDLNQRYIGYNINPKYWGNGYAPEAVKFLNKYLFEELNLDLIWTSHYDFNIKSKRVIEKCSFKYKFNRDVTIKALGKKAIEVFYNVSKEDYRESFSKLVV